MADTNSLPSIGFAPSAYFAATVVKADRDYAWRALLSYERWNPSFVGAQVTRLRGSPGTEGELVLISKTVSEQQGEAFPPFYCETVRALPGHRIVWYVYAKERHSYRGYEDPFRNFVDFGLMELPDGLHFTIAYYAQNRLAPDNLSQERGFMQPLLDDIATAFSKYCESTGSLG